MIPPRWQKETVAMLQTEEAVKPVNEIDTILADYGQDRQPKHRSMRGRFGRMVGRAMATVEAYVRPWRHAETLGAVAVTNQVEVGVADIPAIQNKPTPVVGLAEANPASAHVVAEEIVTEESLDASLAELRDFNRDLGMLVAALQLNQGYAIDESQTFAPVTYSNGAPAHPDDHAGPVHADARHWEYAGTDNNEVFAIAGN